MGTSARNCYLMIFSKDENGSQVTFDDQKKIKQIPPNEFLDLIPKEILDKMKIKDLSEHKGVIQTIKEITENNPNSENKEIYYQGEINEKQEKNGLGKMIIFKDKNEKIFYQGKWENDVLNSGTIYYENGSEYEGDINNYLRDGKGVLKTNNDNEIYEGYWKDDKKEGEGKIHYKDGLEYIGEFKNNKFNGRGKMELSNGIIYEGEFKNNYFHGKGYLRGNNGHIYNGDFRKGYFHGEGEFKWIDGMSVKYYKGNYSYGIKDGHGEFHFENGDIYKGGWKSGEPDGEGVYETKNRKYICNWRAGILMQLIDSVDKQDVKEEYVKLTFKTPREDIIIEDPIITSLDTDFSEKGSNTELLVEIIKND